jgi:hypothetical protein
VQGDQVNRVVYIVSDQRDGDRLRELADPLKKASFDVRNIETALPGTSMIADASAYLSSGAPIVLCATANALSRAWSKQLVNSANTIGNKVIVVEMDEGLDLQSLSLNTATARYWENPVDAMDKLIAALNARFPELPRLAEKPVAILSGQPEQYLEAITDAVVPSFEALGEFRALLKEDIAEEYPQSLSVSEFLQRTSLARDGRLTRTGLLLVGENPSDVLCGAIIECSQYQGTDLVAPSVKTEISGTAPSQIVRARDYLAERVKQGEAATASGAYAEPVYAYPMIAIREILANAVAHRDYSVTTSCVQVRLFDDRIEIDSPGTWMNRELGPGPLPINSLAGKSKRRNFQLARKLTWIRLVEGEGKGIPTVENDCTSVGARIPTVGESDGIITVTVFPRPRPELADADPGPRWKVFVSSNGFGLNGFRDVAREVIDGFRYEGLRCFEPVMVEDFGATDAPAREVLVGKVRECDLLVGIVGIRYGDHPPDDQTSFTEIEFQTAVVYRVSRLMYLLDARVAQELEGGKPQSGDRKDRQEQFRERVMVDRVSDMTVKSAEDFGKELSRALETWVRDASYTRTLVGHGPEFRAARERLLRLSQRTGGAVLIFGAPGTGKTTLFRALLNDIPVRRTYSRLIGPVTVRLADTDAAVQARAAISAELDRIAGQEGVARSVLPPVLITLFLESDRIGGEPVDPGNLDALEQLFTWDVPCPVVVAETNNTLVRERLDRDLGWDSGAVITVGDYDSVDDALEQLRRDAPGVQVWPEPETRILAEALGLRPISLYAAAKDIEGEARRSPRLVAARIRQQLKAIGRDESSEGRYQALIRNSIENLSAGARDLLAMMTVLHPKPATFPDDVAVALDLSLELDEAIAIATADNDSDLDDRQLRYRDAADERVAELVDRGLLERASVRRPDGQDAPPPLALHPANIQVIQESLPLTIERRAEGHARAEAFYRALVGQAVSGSFDDRFRMKDDTWRGAAEEWIYHLAYLAPDRAAITFAALFFDAYWWWDLYVTFDFCGQLLDYARRPRVQAVSPEMPQVAALLATFRDTYPREHESTLALLHAEIAGGGPERAASLRRTATKGAGVLAVLRNLCGSLGITELDGLFGDPAPEPEETPDVSDDETRLHLLGLICLFLAGGHRFRAELEPDGTGLAAAEACYRRAETYFRAEEDDWDVAWTRYLLGEVISEGGRDPDPLWEQAEDAADEESDTELLANIERARGDHLRARNLDGALTHYGRAVFYGLALQVTTNPDSGADAYTQAFYREMQLRAVKTLAEPVLHDQASSLNARVAEANRRLTVMLGEWGDTWRPDQAKLDQALREASREKPEQSAAAIAGAAFPPGPGDAVLGKRDSDYYRTVDDLIERTRTQSWPAGLARWADRDRR